MKTLDKILSQSLLKQLGSLLLLIVFVGVLLFILYPNPDTEGETINRISQLEIQLSQINEGDTITSSTQKAEATESEIGNRIWFIVSRLLDPGQISDSKEKGYALIITLLGWLLCGGLLITILINSYTNRINKIEQGETRYSFKNHCVILGNNELTRNIIKEIRKEKIIPEKSAIIILSIEDSNQLRLKLKSFLTKEEEKNLYVFRGERESKDQLKQLSLHKANRVFIVGERNEVGTDSTNIECLKKISNVLCQEKIEKEALLCHLNIENQHIFSLMQKYDLDNEIKGNIALQTFNIYENWARSIMSLQNISSYQNYALIKKQILSHSNRNTIRYIVVGFNRMGKALCSQIARVSHYGSHKRTIISIVDIKAKELQSQYEMSIPGKNDLLGVEFEFIECAIEDQSIRNKITKWSENDVIASIALCFENPDTSLFVGLNLPAAVYAQNIPVLVRQEVLNGFVTSVNKEERFKNLSFFGMKQETLNLTSDIEEKAKKLHQNYLRMKQESAKDAAEPLSTSDKSLREWDRLDEKYRWSNRYAIDIYPHKIIALLLSEKSEFRGVNHDQYGNILRALFFNTKYPLPEGKDPRKLSIAEQQALIQSIKKIQLSPEQKQNYLGDIELLAEIEHNRWIAERVIGGWTYADIPRKNESLLQHPDIIEYNKLDELTQMYDRNPSVDLFTIYEIGKWHIYRKTAPIKAKLIENDYTIKSLENPKLPAKKGEMHCIGIKNEEWAVDAEKFKQKYILDENVKEDEKGFRTYLPNPETSMIFGRRIDESSFSVITTEGKKLYAKTNDIHAKSYDPHLMPEDIHNDWTIDKAIFDATYIKYVKGNG